jgi:hypothetical protein
MVSTILTLLPPANDALPNAHDWHLLPLPLQVWDLTAGSLVYRVSGWFSQGHSTYQFHSVCYAGNSADKQASKYL